MSYVVRGRARKVLAAAGLAIFLTLASGCAGDSEAGSGPSSAGSSAAATAEPTARTAADSPGSSINGIPFEKELTSDAYGEYRQTTIAPDDPAFIFGPELIHTTATERYTEEEIHQAHRTAVEYAAVAIDSPMNGSPGDEASSERWWAANQHRFVPHYREEMRAAAASPDINDTIVYKGTHRDGVEFGLQYGSDVAHIVSRTIETKSIYGGELDGETAIAVELEVNFSNAIVKDGKKDVEYARGDMTFTLLKDASTGKFLISGNNATYTTSRI